VERIITGEEHNGNLACSPLSRQRDGSTRGNEYVDPKENKFGCMPIG
jgi:hypothetical protein